LRKGLTRERFSTFFSFIDFLTLRGARAMPAIMACPYFLPSVPSSKVFTISPFLPAMRPLSTITTLPAFRLCEFSEIGAEERGGKSM
jgi:hypothetical protein